MATIHQATIVPTKLELLAGWLPGRAWYPDDSADGLERVGAFRFDDPAGEVGVETLVVQAPGGPLTQVPLTYRAAPLDGAERWLIGTMEHSTLGSRWVYDATGDPVYLATLAFAIRSGGTEAPEFVENEKGEPQQRDPLMRVRGTGHEQAEKVGDPGILVRVEDGDPTVIATEHERITLRRILTDQPADEHLTLTGTWPGLEQPLVLAEVAQLTW